MRKTIIAFIILAAIALPSLVSAHPMGIRLWGHRADITLKEGGIEIDYTIEIPVTKLALMMEQYKNSKNVSELSSEYQESFRNELIDYLISGIEIKSDGAKIPLRWNDSYPRKGNDGDPGFFEYHLHLVADINTDRADIEIKNDNYPIQRAVFMNNIADTEGAHAINIARDSGPPWSDDEARRSIKFSYQKGAPSGGTVKFYHDEAASEYGSSELFGHLKTEVLTPGAVAIALLIALALGALHALSPGHGKALVAAYLVGSEGTVGHALLLGVTVTAAHVVSVFTLGIAGLLLAQYILPEYYMPFISLIAGIIVVIIGARLFFARMSSAKKEHHGHHHDNGEHEEKPKGLKNLLILGISGGAAPCPTAMAVMLTAIAIGRTTFGLALISAFSLGLAIVLTAIGIIMVKTKKFTSKIKRFDKASKYLPLASAIIVTLLGLAIIYEGFLLPWMAVK